MIPAPLEKRLLQIVMSVACLVPLSAGLTGMLMGSAMLDASGINLDSHFRYLSGLLFGIGLGFVSAIPRIEQHAARVRLLSVTVFIGGLARIYGAITQGQPDNAMTAAIVMETIITPLLCFWQMRLARRYGTGVTATL